MDAPTQTQTLAAWHAAIPCWLESLGDRLPSRRRLRKFREFCAAEGLGHVPAGVGVARALDDCVASIREAGRSPESASDLHTLRQARRQRLADEREQRRQETSAAADYALGHPVIAHGRGGAGTYTRDPETGDVYAVGLPNVAPVGHLGYGSTDAADAVQRLRDDGWPVA